MRVLVVGAGSLGTVVGAALAASGQDVVVWCRPAQVAALQAHGLRVAGVRVLQAPVTATADAARIGPVDYLILTVKTRDTAAALAPLRAVPAGTVLSLQNGLVKDEQLAAVFGPERVIGAATILGATARAPGEAEWTLAGLTYLGELGGPPDAAPSARVAALAAAFNAAGLPCEAVADARVVEWSKLCQIVPAAALSALTRLEYYRVCKEPHLARLFVDLTHECAAVAHAEGVAIDDFQGFNPRTLTTLPRAEAAALIVQRGADMEARGLTAMRISLLQDVLRGRPTEVEETLGHVVQRAAALGVDVPGVRFALAVIRGVEAYLPHGAGR